MNEDTQPTAGALIGRRVFQARKRAGLSQGALQAYSGLHKSYISKLENGRVPKPGVAQLQRIAAVLNVSVEELLETPGDAVDMKIPTGMASAVRQIIRFSVDQVNNLAESAGLLYRKPAVSADDPAKRSHDDNQADH